jgi:hypothetical protein
MNTDKHGWGVRVVIGVAFWLAAITVADAATPVPGGKWSFVFTDVKGQADRPIRVYTYRPRYCDSKCPIQFVMHGAKRNASDYRDAWELLADRYGLLIIAPEFSEKLWPKAEAYNLGDVAASDNREKWTYSAIEHIFDEMRDGQKDYRIFGHSAGGQFVQRFMLFRPDNRSSIAIASNPGWYMMPEWPMDKAKEKYPYSTAGSRVGEAQLREALTHRFVLMLGESEADAEDPNLNSSEAAKKQGATRVERGENFFFAASGAAAALGVKMAWEMSMVPGAAHELPLMSRTAADQFYTVSPKR